MAGGYKSTPTGVDGIAAKFAEIDRRLNALSSAAGIQSATIGSGGLTVYDSATGTRAKVTEGGISFWHDYDPDNPSDPMKLIANTAGSLWMIAPNGGGVFMNAEGVDVDGNPGSAWVQSSGNVHVAANAAIDIQAGDFILVDSSDQIRLDAPGIKLNSIPSVGAPDFDLGYDLTGGDYTIVFVTSAAKYKQDIKPAVIDPDAVLAIEPVTFRDKSTVERDGEGAKAIFGVIADQLDELGLGDLLVTYVDGEVETVKYDRIGVAIIPAVRKLRDRVDEQDKLIAALTKRLDALEKETP